MTLLSAVLAEWIGLVLIVLAVLIPPAVITAWSGWRAGLGWRGFAQPMRDWRSLWQQPLLEPDFASPLARLWPTVALAATIMAGLLVPSFAKNIWTGVPDLALWIIGLLALARIARLLATLDAGQGARGLAAALSARSFWVVQTILLIGTLAAASAVGSTSLGVGLPLGGAGLNRLVLLLALAAAIVGLANDQSAPEGDLAGPDLAMLRLEAQLRPIIVLLLVFALFAPLWLATANQPSSWPLGLIGFWLRWGLGMIAMAIAPRGAWRVGLIAMLLIGLAVVMVLPR
jgi:hypothetical protein